MTPMRKSLRKETRARLLEILEAGGGDPLMFLVDVVRDESIDKQTRLRAAMFLVPFCHPRQHGCPPCVDDVVQQTAKMLDTPT